MTKLPNPALSLLRPLPIALRRVRVRATVLVVAGFGALLAAGQLFLPPLAESRARDRIEQQFGAVPEALSVDGFPAVAMIVGGPQRVAFEMDEAIVTDDVDALGKADRVDAHFGALELPAVDASDVSFSKDGDRFESELTVDDSLPLPGGGKLDLSIAADGTIEAALPRLGVPLEIVPVDGAVVARPRNAGPLAESALARPLATPSAFQIEDLSARAAGEQIELSVAGEVVA